MPNVSNTLILRTSIVDIRSCKSKRTNKNKDSPTMTVNATTKKQNNNDSFVPVMLTESIRSYKSENTNIKNNNNKQNGTPIYIRAIKHSLILVTLTKSVHCCKSKYINTENNDNKQNETPIHLCIIGC